MLYPDTKDYSFYSKAHNSYSRIDFFLMKYLDLWLVKSSSIEQILVSDHAVITLTLEWGPPAGKQNRWRLNDSLLQDPAVEQDLKKELLPYFELNKPGEVSAPMIWEAHKALIRGHMIKHGARAKKACEKRSMELLQKLRSLERAH